MRSRLFALLISILLFQLPGISQYQVNDCGEKPGAPQKLFVFIGELLHTEVLPARENYNEARFSATYSIIEKVCGHYTGDTILLNVIQVDYDSSFKKNKYQLLMLTKDAGVNHDYVLWAGLYFDVLPTANKQWAITYTSRYAATYENQTKLEPKKIRFARNAFYDTRGMTREEIDITYPEPYYKIKKDKAIPLQGNTISEILQHEKEGTLAYADIYERPKLPPNATSSVVPLQNPDSLDQDAENAYRHMKDSLEHAAEKAFPVIKDSLSHHPFDEATIGLLLKNCRERKDFSYCSQYFEHLIQDYPDSAQAYFLKAKFAHRRASLEDSSRISLLLQAMNIDSNHYDASYDLALSYYRFFNKQPNPYHAQAARKWLTRCIAIDTAEAVLLKYAVIQLSNYLNDTFTIRAYQQFSYQVHTNPQGIPSGNKHNWYFPVETFFKDRTLWINDYTIDIIHKLRVAQFRLDWFSKSLAWFKEPMLTAWHNRKVYRFLWLRSFHVPIVIQIEQTKRSVTMYWKVPAINDSLRTLEPPTTFKKKLALRQWKTFEKSLTTIDFWSMVPGDYLSSATDGAVWLLEASINGQYKIVERSGYIYPKYTACLRYLIDLTDLNLPENDIY